MRAFSIAVLLIVVSVCSGNRASAIDPAYAITINSPSNYQAVTAGSTISISGNVNWPWYYPDIDAVEGRVYDGSDQPTGGWIANIITNSDYWSYCDFGTSNTAVCKFDSPGTYRIEFKAMRGNTVKNIKSVLIVVQ